MILVGLPQLHQVKLWLSPVGVTNRFKRRSIGSVRARESDPPSVMVSMSTSK